MARSVYDRDVPDTTGGLATSRAGDWRGDFRSTPAVIPTSFDSAGGFELTGAPDRPIPQRLQFGPAEGSDFSFGAPQAGAAVADVVTAGNSPGALPRLDEIADLKPLGQVSSSFIVAVNGEGLWIIDQHVAHERVLFEQHLRARREGEMGGQRVLVPLIVDLNHAAAGHLRADWRGAAREWFRSRADGANAA